jgi:two-component system sensor histidine kinase/response regulator
VVYYLSNGLENPELILVVDDNTSNQFVARVVLEKFGYKTHIVENGEEAIKAAAAEQYQLILMDCRMPICDGYEATEAIRAMQARSGKRVPIIGVTACAMEGDREKCLAAGMDDYITKPLTLEDFKTLLLRWLATR